MKKEPAKFIKKISFPKNKHIPASLINHPSVCHISAEQPALLGAGERQEGVREIRKQDLVGFEVVGLMRNQIFCIYSEKLGMFGTVDQHALHQRIRYEYYSGILRGNSVAAFRTTWIQKHQKRKQIEVLSAKKTPKLLHIMQTSNDQIKGKTINKYGMSICIDGQGEVYLTHFSQVIGRCLEVQVLRHVCQQIVEFQIMGSNNLPAALDDIIAENACKSAIKFGDEITKQWCIDMLYNASLCDFPWKCVHGRSTVHFTSYSLAKQRNYSLDE